MGRWAGVRPPCSSNNGKSKAGKRPDGQARSLTYRLDRNLGLAKCIVTALDIAARDDVVERELETVVRTDDGRLTRRSKLKFLLVRKGLLDDAVEKFVNEDVDDILGLFRVFNDGTHGKAGQFNLNELVAVKQRAESGIRFLYALSH